MPGQSRKPGLDRDNPRLQVNLLGHPTITWHGELLEIPRARVRALLYYLAAHRQPLARSELCYLFWPDKPDPIARRNLSHHLTHLRRALPPDMLLIHGPDHVQLDDRRVASDLHSFENACRQALEAGAIAELEGIARRVPTVILAGFELSGCPNFDT